jgi:BirA family transcriptional regulator, biotin operon repressor / biotin---[acetyl-CoA-carboxylase] ligase
MSIGNKMVRKEVVVSTNDLAKDYARDGEGEGLVVMADRQTGGKGRMGRAWSSPQGGLYFSVLLRPRLPVAQLLRFTILVAEPIADAIQKECGCQVGLKWPNDLMVDERKVGGILVEIASCGQDIEFLILGIGINLNATAEEIGIPDSGSLRDCCHHEISAELLLEEILAALDSFYLNFQTGRVDDEAYTRRSVTIGKQIEATIGGVKVRGKALFLDMDGALLIRTPDGMVLRLDSVHDTTLRVLDEPSPDRAEEE